VTERIAAAVTAALLAAIEDETLTSTTRQGERVVLGQVLQQGLDLVIPIEEPLRLKQRLGSVVVRITYQDKWTQLQELRDLLREELDHLGGRDLELAEEIDAITRELEQQP